MKGTFYFQNTKLIKVEPAGIYVEGVESLLNYVPEKDRHLVEKIIIDTDQNFVEILSTPMDLSNISSLSSPRLPK